MRAGNGVKRSARAAGVGKQVTQDVLLRAYAATPTSMYAPEAALHGATAVNLWLQRIGDQATSSYVLLKTPTTSAAVSIWVMDRTHFPA